MLEWCRVTTPYVWQSLQPSYGTFNTTSRQRTDDNIDVTALARFTPDERRTYELGFAQKTRSPNLYERYTWSTNNAMAMHMNNWFGDGNGYVGDINLKPEVARTLSSSAAWQDGVGAELKIAPYYTRVQNFIDAARCHVAAGTACTAPTRSLRPVLSICSSSIRARDFTAQM